MSNIALKQVHYEGITMQIPEIWDYETEEYNEEDGTKSYSMSISAKGRDVRSIDISWGIIPEGSNAYEEACATYEEVAALLHQFGITDEEGKQEEDKRCRKLNEQSKLKFITEALIKEY